jgi:sporulation protein YqfC
MTNLQKLMGETFDVPKEISMNAIKITITGSSSLLAENHKGIKEYNEEKIVFDSTDSSIEVYGQRLLLRSLTNDELIIEGEIAGLAFKSL